MFIENDLYFNSLYNLKIVQCSIKYINYINLNNYSFIKVLKQFISVLLIKYNNIIQFIDQFIYFY